MRKIIRSVVIALGAFILLLVLAGLIIHRPLPEGTSGPEAEALADSMLSALGYQHYNAIEEIGWTYPRGHYYTWNKKSNEVKVAWSAYKVFLKPDSLTGSASKNGTLLSGKDQEKAVWEAWKLFANDSFWLTAPFKVRDPGTKRAVVETERGKALLVTYTAGGVTPGDSYLWFLDENYRPVAWQLWVKIIPVGGLEFSWENWQEKEGAWFALDHNGPGPVRINLTDLKIN